MTTRIAKFIADSGFASRRAAEELIAMGRVSVNGEKITSPICFVSDDDIIEIDGNAYYVDSVYTQNSALKEFEVTQVSKATKSFVFGIHNRLSRISDRRRIISGASVQKFFWLERKLIDFAESYFFGT